MCFTPSPLYFYLIVFVFIFDLLYLYWRVLFPVSFIKMNLFLYTNPVFYKPCGFLEFIWLWYDSFFLLWIIDLFLSISSFSISYLSGNSKSSFFVLIYNVLINLPIWFDFFLYQTFYQIFFFSHPSISFRDSISELTFSVSLPKNLLF